MVASKTHTGIFSLVFLSCLVLVGCSGGSDGGPNGGPVASTPAAVPSQTLPILSISTNGVPITSREDYIPADYILADKDGVELLRGATEIKGRGNSTWLFMPKKPYHMKLATAQSVLGMPANRHWVLLANYADKTMIRNDLAFELGRWLGMPYTPRSEFVEVQLNGKYEGVYQLTEHIRIAPDRVNIKEMKVTDNTPELVTGGYLLEVDDNRGEPFCFDMVSPMVICSKNPEDLNTPEWTAQRDYIVGYLRQTEDAIFSPTFATPSTGYAAYLDVDSLVNYYIAHELFKNLDGPLVSSTYMYKDRGKKLFLGPIWDFDLAAGNADRSGAEIPEGWYIRNAPWYERLFEDPAFAEQVKAKWAALKSAGRFDQIRTHIDERAAFLDKAQAENFKRWPILSTKVFLNPVALGSYDAEVNALKLWLATRIAWMDSELSAP